MGKSQDAPESPDPRVTIPLQGQENRRTFDYQLAGMRTNTNGPFGSQTWSQTPTFDEAGYNAAMAEYQRMAGGGGTGGSPAPAPAPTPVYRDGQWIQENGSEYWSPGGGAGAGVGGAAPSGQSQYAIAPSRDQFTRSNWTMNQTLSPEQQALYDSNVQSQLGQADLLSSLTDRVSQSTSNPFDASQFQLQRGLNIPGLEELGGLRGQLADLDPQAFNQQMADSVYSQADRYLRPQLDREEGLYRSQLADQGFNPGTPGYDTELSKMRDNRSKVYGDLRDRSVVSGFNLGAQNFGNARAGINDQIAALLQGNQQNFNQQLAGQQQNNSVVQQQLANALAARNQPLNELNAMRTGTQVQLPQGATSSPTPNLQPTDLMGAFNQQYQNQLGAYNAEAAGQNDLFGSLLGLGGLFAGPGGLAKLFGSDRRLKEDIQVQGKLPSGLGVYSFRYLGGKSKFLGVMADEVAAVFPKAVVYGPDGYASVDYGRVW